MKSTPAKYQHVRANLEVAIRSGEFAVGEQLPNEQALAERFGVSYLTARRAVCELVEADLLERRSRKGTFVRSHVPQKSTITLSLVTSSYDHSLMRDFIARGSHLAELQGWQPNVIRLSAGQQDAAVRAIRGGDLALVLLDEVPPRSALAHAMLAARGKAICLGSPTDAEGVPCILNNPGELFHAATHHLRSAGHHDIVFVGQASLESTSRLHAEAWHQATADFFSADQADAAYISVHTPLFHCPTHDAYDAVSHFLNSGPHKVTAFVSMGEEITQGVMAAIRDSGRAVPDDISVVNILDSPAMRFANPPVTSVDVNFKAQFEIALNILEAALNSALPAEKFHFVKPHIVERKSVRPAEATLNNQAPDELMAAAHVG